VSTLVSGNYVTDKYGRHGDAVAVAYLLQVSDELFVAHEMLSSRLVDQQQLQLQQQHPSTDVSFVDGHLSNYQTLVSWCIDSVIQVVTVYLSVFTCAPGMLRIVLVAFIRVTVGVSVFAKKTENNC